MNNSTKKLFIGDSIVETVSFYFIIFFLYTILTLLYQKYQTSFDVIEAIILITIIVILTYNPFPRILHKSRPLPEESLKSKITSLVKKSNVSIKGFGIFRKTILFDTLVKGLNEDEIISIVARSLYHAKHKSILKSIPIDTISFSLIEICRYFLATIPTTSIVFGFYAENYMFNLLLLVVVFNIFSLIFRIPQKWYYRKGEEKADFYAAKQQGKANLISALKKFHKLKT